ncbi:restriction endonuclease subunit S [Dyadobacter sp. 3J3]|uniref:restriction endonuclease subunit S n=1 Tax=Dyadobacter sp. 3J3 TaxID=2606600 RepID=UPI00135A30D1|nr:restriction endonuclease subunit S [Dyadobacter sp. 3J3]
MNTTLRNIASIQTGFFAKPVSVGEGVYLQAKNFDENGFIKYPLHNDLEMTDINPKHLLRNGDILFAAKGTKNFAALYNSENGLAVASTSFFVIRLTNSIRDKILPEFLVWFINNPPSLKLLKDQAIGTSIVSISKSVLGELEISVPSLAIQKAILKIAELRNRERKIKSEIENLKEKQVQTTILDALNK